MGIRPVAACIVAIAVWLSDAGPTLPEDRPSASPAGPVAGVADLQTQLQSGLRARLPQEFAFIRRVVAMVKADQLPLDLVMSAFQWARHKKPYPFPYFERALRTRAAKLGIKI